MRYIRLSIFICFLLLIYSQNILAQWSQTSGPCGGNITRLAIKGSNIFAAANTGVYLSTNNGLNWTPKIVGLPNSSIYDLTINGEDIFATNYTSVYLSTDNGLNWNTINGSLTNMCANVLAISDTNIFAGTDGNGIYLSTNKGANWISANNGISVNNINALGVNGGVIYAGGYNYGGNSSIYTSTDKGKSWSQVTTCGYVYAFSFSGSNIYAATDSGISIWNYDGKIRTYVKTILKDKIINSIAVNGKNIVVGAYYDGVYLSTDSGENWTQVNNGLISKNIVNSLIYNGANILAGTEDVGVFLSTNNGNNWTKSSSGIPNTCIQTFAANGTNLYTGACYFDGASGGSVYFSTDSGDSWTEINNGLPMDQNINALAVNDSILFAGLGNGIYRSSDNGSNWTLVLNNKGTVYSFLFDGLNLFSATAGGVFLSTDNGVNWTGINNGLTDKDVRALAHIGTNLFADTYNSGIFRSTNNGTYWTTSNIGQPSMTTCLVVNGSNLFASNVSNVFLSTDNGVSWTQKNNGFTSYPEIHALAVNNSNIFAGTDHGLYRSANNGDIWTKVDDGLRGLKYTHALNINNSYLYAGTIGYGVWKRPLSEITSVNKNKSFRPFDITLSQNYPNPFNPITNISFSVTSETFVSLKIYDILGREVSTLVSEKLPAGTYSRQWNASDFPSGVYFYRLQGNFTETKKLTVLK
jgi:photosystem II stability/assembly factor-like uncharacterized protein